MLIILMGVSGSGKSTIGRLLASRLGWPFLEADEFHPADNRRKLATGIPLTDTDRWPWLDALNAGLREAVQQSGSVILACSALKESHRDRLDDGLPAIRWVHLVGDPALLEERLERRIGHFSSAKILPSQFATLEPPTSAIEIRVDRTPAYVVEQMARSLGIAQVDPTIHDRIIARHLLVEETDATQTGEVFEDLLCGREFRLERIISSGQATPEGEWLQQEQPEWVSLWSGRARLRFEQDENPYDVAPGDAWLIPANCRHRVDWTDAEQPSVWMALHSGR